MTTIQVRVCGRTDIGRERTGNEDALLVADVASGALLGDPPPVVIAPSAPRPFLLAVSDGMGGENAGEVASAITMVALVRSLTESLGKGKLAVDALRAAVRRAHDEVAGAGAAPDRNGMGATLTAALLSGEEAFIAEVGDSRAYLLRGVTFAQLTRDQSYAQFLVDTRAMTPEEAENFPYKNVILQAIGHGASIDVPIGRLSLRRGDRLLLCSDGLTGEVADADIAAILRAEGDVGAASEKLVAAANVHGGEDNITVIVAAFDGDGLREAGPDDDLASTFVSHLPPAPSAAPKGWS